uniref:J domain-containing protein n=1 Tax=viral metagenome TaxID=1070528 RepID=A0A6C0C267_9ZZZZ
MDMDLNLDNYELEDLLNLFKLDYDFDIEQLKQAKKIALKTHPDKSNLPNEYFIFFSKAYNIIYKIYNFRHKRLKKVENVDYKTEDMSESEQISLLEKLKKFKTVKDFNKWFNHVFEKVKINDNTGYGDWFKSNDGVNNDKITNMSQMNDAFEKKKKASKALIKHEGIKEMNDNAGYDLTNNVKSYGTNVFSKLKYEDLKKAHTETVVPVTMDDFYNRKRFDNLDTLKKYRNANTDEPLSLSQSKQYLNTLKKQEDVVNTNRAYNLLKRDEEIENSNKKFWSHLKQLKN